MRSGDSEPTVAAATPSGAAPGGDAARRPASCAGCNRREFVASALVATVSALVTACGDGEIGGPLGPRPGATLDPPLVITLADFPALASVGGVARVDGSSATPVAVSRVGADTFVALSMICPHAAFRPIVIGSDGFTCPNHGARFSKSGLWAGGQRTSSLVRYAVVHDGTAGTLTIG